MHVDELKEQRIEEVLYITTYHQIQFHDFVRLIKLVMKNNSRAT